MAHSADAVFLAFVLLGEPVRLFVRPDLDLGTPVTGATEVAVGDEEFKLAAIAVPAVPTVTWRCEGEDEHNLVSAAFESPIQTTGTSIYTFAERGTYP